jgi:hypothetical protein
MVLGFRQARWGGTGVSSLFGDVQYIIDCIDGKRLHTS